MSVDTVEQSPPQAEAARVETPQKRRQRISTGVLIAIVGVLLVIGLASTTGSARFALSDAFDAVQLPTVTLPGLPPSWSVPCSALRPRSATCPAG